MSKSRADQRESLASLLKATSRSFYLTLRVLPRRIRPQIGLAYLLARTTDTIADTELVPVEQRLEGLLKLSERIAGSRSEKVDFTSLLQFQSSNAERVLLERCEEAIAELHKLSAADIGLVRKVLATITSGQQLDLQRFSGASAAHIKALRMDEELDDYTYRVAGCVGEFWTEMCLAHEFSKLEIQGKSRLSDPAFLSSGVRFGKGLQLVNILRDLPSDLQKGRCYLPSVKLAEAGLSPAELLQPANEPKFRPLYNRYLNLAETHLAAGWNYTNSIPMNHMRVRLACAWPILIGAKTVDRLRAGNVLDPNQRIKVSRPEVKRIMMRTILSYYWQPGWRRLFKPTSTTP